MNNRDYLIKRLEDYRRDTNNKQIPVRLIPSYFGFNFNELGDRDVQIYVNTLGNITLRVSSNVKNKEAYLLVLIGMALVIQRKHPSLEENTLIYDKKTDDVKNVELYKTFAYDLIRGSNELENYAGVRK